MSGAEILGLWQDWVDRLDATSLYTKAEFTERAHSLPADSVAELAAFFLKAKQEAHVTKLDRWLNTLDRNAPVPSAPETGVRCFRMVSWYMRHVEKSTAFASISLLTFNTPAIPDWGKVPPELQFLVAPAQICRKFTYIFSEEGREQAGKEVSDEEKALITAAGEKVKEMGFANVKKWYSAVEGRVHREATCMFNLMGCIDALGVKYY
jgi:hypothetical protein